MYWFLAEICSIQQEILNKLQSVVLTLLDCGTCIRTGTDFILLFKLKHICIISTLPLWFHKFRISIYNMCCRPLLSWCSDIDVSLSSLKQLEQIFHLKSGIVIRYFTNIFIFPIKQCLVILAILAVGYWSIKFIVFTCNCYTSLK